MRQIHNTRIVAWLFFIAVFFVSIVVQATVSRNGNAEFLVQAPNYVRGWYGIEQSDALPTSRGAVSAQYQWTYNQAQLRIWPVPAGMRLFTITYLNTLGEVRVLQNEAQIVSLPTSTYIRTAHVLLPSTPRYDLTLVQSHPKVVDDRILGLIVLRFTWHAFNTPDMLATVYQWAMLLLGVPLTSTLAILLCVTARLQSPARLVIAILPIIGTLLASLWSPWHSMAMQPMWQFIIIAGLGGLAIDWVMHRITQVSTMSWLLILWCISSIMLFTPDIQGDGVGYYAYLRSLFVDGDLHFANEFDKASSPFAFLPVYPIYAPTGYTINPWSIGPAILQVPFWLVAHITVLISQGAGLTKWAADGYAAPYVTMVGLSSVVAGLVTLFGIYQLLHRQYPQRVAVFSTAFVYLASNLLYYAQINNNNVHSISTATVTLMMVAFMAIQDRATWQRWCMFGVIVGLIGIVYWVTLILCLFPAGVVLAQTRTLWRTRQFTALKHLWSGVGIAAIAAIAVLALQSGVWYIMYHSLFTVPQGSSFAIPQYPRLWQMFFGDWYGLLWWTPALFIGIVGLFFYAKSAPKYGIWMVVAIWVYIIYNASIPNWDGSSGFGFRRLASIAPFIAFGVAHIVARTTTFRQIHVIMFGMLGAWTTRFALRYVEFRIVRSSWAFVDNLVVATFDPAIINVTTFTNVARFTWLGIVWRYASLAQLLVVLMVLASAAVFCYLWYHPIVPQWWGRATPHDIDGQQHDSHITS